MFAISHKKHACCGELFCCCWPKNEDSEAEDEWGLIPGGAKWPGDGRSMVFSRAKCFSTGRFCYFVTKY